MDTFLAALLQIGALSSFRADDMVQRQGVMNHQTACHLMDLHFVRDATEFSIPEAYAVAGLSLATGSREAAQVNLAAQTPQKQ